MPQNPFNVEIRLADSEEIQTDFEVKQPDGSIHMSTTTHTVWRGNEKPANSKKMQLSIATLNATGSGFLEIMCD
jgi:hypothetical protein